MEHLVKNVKFWKPWACSSTQQRVGFRTSCSSQAGQSREEHHRPPGALHLFALSVWSGPPDDVTRPQAGGLQGEPMCVCMLLER